MIKILKNTLVVFAIICFGKTFAQPSVVISNIQVNNQAISSNNIINLGTNVTTNIKFRTTLTKQNTFVLGFCKLLIRSYNSSGVFREYEILPISETQFTNQLLIFSSYDFAANDFDFGEGCYLEVVLKQQTGTGVAYPSQRIKVIKFPTYNGIKQITGVIPCNSNAQVDFILNSNDQGYSSLQWNYGSSWYLRDNYGGLRLYPVSFPLSNITVTPTIHGVVQGTFIFTPILQTITTTATISGANSICPPTTSSVYTIANVGAGNTVSWSSSNTAIATISNATPTSATLNKVGFGNVRIIATITNSCGQTVGVSKQVQILNPVALNPANFNYGATISNQYCDSKHHLVEIAFPY